MTDDLPIVLLHGSATGSHSWAAVRRGLEARGARVVAPDMLGYGRSPTPSEAWQPKDEGPPGQLARHAGRRRVPPRHPLARGIFRTSPAAGRRVSRGAAHVDRSCRRQRAARAGGGRRPARGADPLSVHARVAGSRCGRLPAGGALERRRCVERAGRERTCAGCTARTAATARDDRQRSRSDHARRVHLDRGATSVLVGERTSAAPRSVSRLLAGAFDARMVVIPGTAHMIPLTHPAAVVEAIHADMVAS